MAYNPDVSIIVKRPQDGTRETLYDRLGQDEWRRYTRTSSDGKWSRGTVSEGAGRDSGTLTTAQVMYRVAGLMFTPHAGD